MQGFSEPLYKVISEKNINININDGVMFTTEDYQRIMHKHNIHNKGNHIDFLFEEEHNEYTVPTIYNRLCKACLFAQTENTLLDYTYTIYLLHLRT